MMNNIKKHKVGILIVATIILAVLCCIMSPSWNSNLVSMISGLWSALATAVLGGIAFWQNRRYKELSDEMNDILYAPEFYIPTPANDIENMGKLSLNVISAIGKTPGGLTSVNSYENSFRFSSLDKPIIDLRPIAVVIDGQREEVTVRNYTGLDIFCNHAMFSIKLQNCSTTKDGAHELKIIMHYKNIYSMTYQKIYTTRISVQSGKIVNHNWGTLSRAKRTGKREK